MDATRSALRALCDSLIDYAGLFPPAGLAMAPAVAHYASYLRGAESWMLARFITPAARLGEFEQVASAFWNETSPGWKISALVSENVEADLAAIHAFNLQHAAPSRVHPAAVQVDAMEYKLQQPGDAARIGAQIAAQIPGGIAAYLEIPFGCEPEPFLDAILAVGDVTPGQLRGKLRTGGVTTSAIPDADAVQRFLAAAAERKLPFKATAGLHHATPGTYPLTYEADAACGNMHGFLNLFLAAGALFCGLGGGEHRGDSRDKLALAQAIFQQPDARVFHFDDAGVQWNDFTLTSAQLDDFRRNFAISFGSCSFEEPVADLRTLNLL